MIARWHSEYLAYQCHDDYCVRVIELRGVRMTEILFHHPALFRQRADLIRSGQRVINANAARLIAAPQRAGGVRGACWRYQKWWRRFNSYFAS